MSNGKVLEYTIETESKKDALLTCIGDIHAGHECHENKEAKDFFDYVMNWCYDNKVYVFGMGDFIEAGTKESWGTFTQKKFASEQVKDMIKAFKPIAKTGRLIGILEGNHERRIRNLTGFDVMDTICSMLDVPYFRAGKLVTIIVKNGKKKQEYPFYISHGGTSAITQAGKINAIKRMSGIAPFAEIYCMGHTHTLLHHVEDGYNNMGILIPKHYLLTGSFMTYWESYAQEKGYSPNRMGSPKIKLHVNEHRVSVSEA